jgi:hypothetical protein
MDLAACNFDSEASLPNNSGCEYPALGYDCLEECIVDSDSDGVCDMFEIEGCTDLFANNFNTDATDDDGSCVFPPLSLNAVSDTLCLGDTVIISWTGGDPNDPIYIGLINVTTNSGNGAVVNETSNTGSYSWLFQGVPAGPGDIYKFYITNLPLTTYDYGNHFAICPIVGCMDPMACNYDETATLDDGSCVMPDECGICDGIASGQGVPDGDCDCEGNQLDVLGVCGGDCISDFNGNGICDINETFGCTYSLALNYTTNATVDDGSCEYCTSDLDGNGNVSTSDLLMFLVSFGQYCDEVDACGVINGDGSTCADCAGVPNGTSVVDECGVCGGDNSSCIDCCGVANGDGTTCDSTIDECGTCDNDPTNDCVQDCNGDWGGTAELDECGVCNDDSSDDCVQDCAGEWGGDGSSCIEVEGCMSPMACNYDPLATIPCADNCCDFMSCLALGCTDNDPNTAGGVACNYDPDAEFEDGTCVYAQAPYDCDGECVDDADADGVCDEFEIPGCTDSTACNYNVNATDDDVTCIYPDPGYECEPITVSFDALLSGGQSTNQNMVLSGNLTQVQFNLHFTATAGEWPADMIVAITGANGNCMAGEGFNINPPSTCYNIDFPGDWSTNVNGFYTYTMSALEAGVSGDGTWSFDLQNGWATGADANYDLDIVLFGVTEFVE